MSKTTAAAAAASASASAAPGAEDSSGAEEKKVSPSRAKKTAFLKEGQIIKSIDELDGYNAGKHKPLKKADFEHIWLSLEYQAIQLEKKAAALRSQGERTKKLGNLADQDTARRVLQLQASLEKLTATLDDDARALLAELTAAKVKPS